MRMHMKRFLTTAAVVALAGVAFAGCGGNDKKDTAADSNDTTATTAPSAGGTTLTLVATNFKFDKTALTATAGDSVTFVVKNEADSTEHNLSIEDLKVDKDVEAGESAQQTVSDLKAGTYEYHCEYHPSQMTGTLTVS
jgi:plastocyanin